ncbi:hypothetical protein CORC01_10781 [Colletotrichum orchidophilum]|uniref:Uncharacterized protein n=1 Tax=Colletotrichum orchidophilum TaxID=1209926 RepID=A0A1G4AXW1_9PEZI|nr:uncharacterized protein CORC01_10781 [Colletotrichum orchidophilum]OHE93882.1 hypothetical protein CORC01_10781 [Colletotrichum orchidophilum]
MAGLQSRESGTGLSLGLYSPGGRRMNPHGRGERDPGGQDPQVLLGGSLGSLGSLEGRLWCGEFSYRYVAPTEMRASLHLSTGSYPQRAINFASWTIAQILHICLQSMTLPSTLIKPKRSSSWENHNLRLVWLPGCPLTANRSFMAATAWPIGRWGLSSAAGKTKRCYCHSLEATSGVDESYHWARTSADVARSPPTSESPHQHQLAASTRHGLAMMKNFRGSLGDALFILRHRTG